MQIEGNVLKVGAVQSGTSQAGNPWRRQEYVVEFYEYPQQMWSEKIVFSLMNDNIDKYSLTEGTKVKVRFELNYREYNGKYYMEVRLAQDGIEVTQRPGQPAQAPQPAQQVQAQESTEAKKEEVEADDLPF